MTAGWRSTSSTPAPGSPRRTANWPPTASGARPDTQNVDGSGLGLPIVAVLVEASGGHLELLAGEPRGLHARLWLPTP